jgi:uncharacterized membrane protein (DUF106 family)
LEEVKEKRKTEKEKIKKNKKKKNDVKQTKRIEVMFPKMAIASVVFILFYFILFDCHYYNHLDFFLSIATYPDTYRP